MEKGSEVMWPSHQPTLAQPEWRKWTLGIELAAQTPPVILPLPRLRIGILLQPLLLLESGVGEHHHLRRGDDGEKVSRM
jgi:hypothetical protein